MLSPARLRGAPRARSSSRARAADEPGRGRARRLGARDGRSTAARGLADADAALRDAVGDEQTRAQAGERCHVEARDSRELRRAFVGVAEEADLRAGRAAARSRPSHRRRTDGCRRPTRAEQEPGLRQHEREAERGAGVAAGPPSRSRRTSWFASLSAASACAASLSVERPGLLGPLLRGLVAHVQQRDLGAARRPRGRRRPRRQTPSRPRAKPRRLRWDRCAGSVSRRRRARARSRRGPRPRPAPTRRARDARARRSNATRILGSRRGSGFAAKRRLSTGRPPIRCSWRMRSSTSRRAAAVPGAVGVHDRDRPLAADPEAADLGAVDSALGLVEAELAQAPLQVLPDSSARSAGAQSPCAHRKMWRR